MLVGRFLGVIVYACLNWLADADVYTFQDVEIHGPSFKRLKTLHVDASLKPLLIEIRRFSCAGSDGSDGRSSWNVVLAPLRVNVSKVLECNVLNNDAHSFALKKNKPSKLLHATSRLQCGIVRSDKIALDHSGAYGVYVTHCSSQDSFSMVSFEISGAELAAHDRGWWLIYIFFATLHVFLCNWWAFYKRNAGEIIETNQCVKLLTVASVTVAISHCVGFVAHYLPEKESMQTVKLLHTFLWPFAMSSVMVALMATSGVGCSAPGRWCRFYCHVLFFVMLGFGCWEHMARFEDYMILYEGDATIKTNTKAKMLGFAGSFVVFGLICVRLLARSFRSFREGGLDDALAGSQKLAVIVFIYALLGIFSSGCIAYDDPSDEPNVWVFHRFAGAAVTQITQSFGLGAAMLIFKNTDFGVRCSSQLPQDCKEEVPDEEKTVVHHTSSQEFDVESRGEAVVYGTTRSIQPVE